MSFGWSAVVPPFRATTTAITIEPSELLLFEARALRDALELDDDLAGALDPRLLRAVACLQATRLQLLDMPAEQHVADGEIAARPGDVIAIHWAGRAGGCRRARRTGSA